MSGLKASTIFALVFLWLTSLVLLLSKTQANTLTPALLIHTSCLLLLLLLVKTFKGQWANDLATRSCLFLYLALAAFLGLVFFQTQQFTCALFWPNAWQQEVILWQQAQRGFSIWSVFLASCLIGPIFEEFLFRGLVFSQLKEKIGYLLAVIISSGLFTLLHWDIKESVWLFSAGVLYAVLRKKSGSIWPPTLAHIIQNVMTFWLYVSV